MLAVFVVATGCIPALNNRVPESAIVPKRVVAMPPQVLLYTLDASGQQAYGASEDNSVGDIVDQVLPELKAVMAANGGHLAQRDPCGRPCAQFFSWGGTASLEIGLQRAQIRNYESQSVADWKFRGDISFVRTALDADFALFVVLKQTRETTGRKVAFALSGHYTLGKQIGVACIADLRDGRMTWCSTARDDRSDLTDPGRIPYVMRQLLQGVFVFPAPPAPPSQPVPIGDFGS